MADRKPSWRPAAAIAALMALTPAAGVAGGLALAPAVAGAGLVSLQPRPLWAGLRAAPLLSAAAFGALIWTVLSAFWSPIDAWAQAGRIVGTALPGWVLVSATAADPRARRAARAGGAAACIVLAVLLATEALWGMPLNRAAQTPSVADWLLARNPGRGASILVVLIWPALTALLGYRRVWGRGAALLLLAAAFALSMQFLQLSNLLAALGGLAAFAAACAAPRLALFAVFAATAGWLLLAPLAAPLLASVPGLADSLPETWAIRAEIWRFAGAQIAAEPLFGHGLDAARSFDTQVPFRGETIDAMPLHPHSVSLQIWLETGGIGACLAAAALLIGGARLAQRWRGARLRAAACAGALASFAVLSNISYGAWQEWWIAAAACAAALIAAAPAGAETESARHHDIVAGGQPA